MKTRIFSLIMMLMCAMMVEAQTYNQLWENVKAFQENDLPKSEIAEAKKIFAKANSERNVPQMMKAYLTMMACRGNISPDSISVDIKGLEEWASEPDLEPQNRAVLNSILGGFLASDDFEKANRYLHLSLKDSLNLVDYPADKLAPMVTTGETSRMYFDNNLYDLLARRAIRLWEQNQWRTEREKVLADIQHTYQSLLHIYKVKQMRKAWLLTSLDASPRADEAMLRQWMEEYADLDVCAEVYLRLDALLQRKNEPAERLVLLREAINRYPRYSRINALKNKVNEILAPRLALSVDYVYPGEPMDIQVNHRNLQGFSISVYRIKLSVESPLLNGLTHKNVTKYGKLVRREHFDLPSTSDYKERCDTVNMQLHEAGIYYLVAEPDGHAKERQGVRVNVSSLFLLGRGLPHDCQELVVLDKQSGHPVPGAKIGIFDRKGDGFVQKETFTANPEGVVIIKGKGSRNVYCQAYIPGDEAMPIHWKRFTKVREQIDAKKELHVRMFTDRSLYRPGQTVYFSGIAYGRLKDSLKVQEGAELNVTLKDANHQVVASQLVNTDAYGGFHGTFELPKAGKLGAYHLETERGSVSFRVEEYKRPTFDVTFDTIRTSYQAGDSILVKGLARTFAGAPVQGAKVRYKIARLENNFWRTRGVETNRVEGESMTDADGHFELPVHFLPIKEGERTWFYTYEVLAEVTNIAGETQEATLILPLGSSSLKVFIQDWNDGVLVKEKPEALNIKVVNLKGVPVSANVDCKVYALSEDNKLGSCVWQGTLDANRPIVPEALYALPSGRYQLHVSVTDEAGRENGEKVDFVLFSLNDKRLPYSTEIWSYQLPVDEEGNTTICLGSREEDVCLYFDAYSENGITESRRIHFSDSLLTFRYAYQEEYGTGLRFSFTFVKHGKVFARYFELPKPKPEKTLHLKWKSFRDQLLPGSHEKWTLSVRHSDGKPANAQLMATMYDASLDKLLPHDWRMSLNFGRYIPVYYWNGYGAPEVYWGCSFPVKRNQYKNLDYSRLFLPASNEEMAIPEVLLTSKEGRGNTLMMKFAPSSQRQMLDEKVEEENAVDTDGFVLEDIDKIQLRTNFAETAFFYPNLQTNSNGDVTLEFTMPESLTEWKFMGLAHTMGMDYGGMTDKVVVSKKFMLQPNLPRFVRVGDQVNVRASLVNLSDEEVSGFVRMELFVPETEKVVLSQKRPFKVCPDGTEQVVFSFSVSDKYEGLACRMVADGKTFSDGEQRYLPVLSNKQKLTESVLLNVNGAGAYTFSLDDLFNRHSKTVSNPKMWVEFTGNPLWYAVQALNAIKVPEMDNAYSWATAYYSNALLEHLDKIESRVADSLNIEGIEENINESILKLKDLQGKDGSWSWYKGMTGSLYMTTGITQLLARLNHTLGDLPNAEVKQMYQSAWDYLNRQASEEVSRMKDAEKKGSKNLQLSDWILQYLYVDALDEDLNPQKEVRDYLIDKLEDMSANLTIYGKAMSSIILQKAGRVQSAEIFLRSLIEYSVITEEMGRYFDSPKAYYSWFSYRIPTQVAAIEALSMSEKNETEVEEMKQWLLKQKQGQVWKTSISTTDAVYALLTTGEDWLSYSGETRIKIGKETIDIPEKKGAGYVKEEVSGNVMGIRKIKVEKEGHGLAWGAVYAEFEEDLDKVTSVGNALKIERLLYLNGKPLAEGESLKVGDRLTVLLKVTADRDMDFVQIVDERAACLEPIDVLSGYRWNGRVGYYQETRDASTAFYLDKMRKGTYELKYDVYVVSTGVYLQGVATARSVYAPEFSGHTSASVILSKP